MNHTIGLSGVVHHPMEARLVLASYIRLPHNPPDLGRELVNHG